MGSSRLTAAVALGAVATMAAAGQPLWAAEPVKIGELNSYTAIPAFTVPYHNGWQLAVDEINKAGGVLGGRKLEVISRDDGANPAAAVSAAEELIGRDGVTVVAGTLLANVGLAVADLARQRKVVFLATEATADALVWTRGNRYTFRLAPGCYLQAAVLAEQAARLPAKRWATVAPGFEQGRALVADFKTLLKAKRPDVEFVDEEWPTLGKLDAQVVVQNLERANPEALFNATFAGDLTRLVEEGDRRGLFKKRPVVSALTGEPEYLDVLGADAPEGWLVTGYPWYDIRTPEHRRFVDAYMAAYDEDPRLGALIGYTAIKAIAAALDRAGSTDPERLVAAFEGLNFSSPAGPLSFRAVDHQSTMGAWIGRTAQRDGTGVMVGWSYADGARYLPPPEQVKKLRNAD